MGFSRIKWQSFLVRTVSRAFGRLDRVVVQERLVQESQVFKELGRHARYLVVV